MNKKWVPPPYVFVIVIFAVVLALFLLFGSAERGRLRPKSTTSQKKNDRPSTGSGQTSTSSGQSSDPASTVNRNHGFDRRVSYIEYTQHAKCRMQCRKISQAEVEEIMKDGEINYRKTDVNARPCPAYAVEGITEDDQRVRIVFGQCDLKTKVITCIDLNTDWECHCPGDDNKYKNKN